MPAERAQLRVVAPTEDLSDEALMRAVVRGDAGAFRVLVERHLAAVRRFCARATEAGLADELAQETFSRVWQSRTRWTDGASFCSFLYTVALNLCRNHRRGRLRWMRALVTLEQVVPKPALRPDELLETRVEAERLRVALLALPEAQREALLLQYAAGLDSQAVGEALGCNPSTARSRVFHGLKRLRDLLGGTP